MALLEFLAVLAGLLTLIAIPFWIWAIVLTIRDLVAWLKDPQSITRDRQENDDH